MDIEKFLRSNQGIAAVSATSFTSGILALYAYLLFTGRFALWHGPELRDWNLDFWSEPAQKYIDTMMNNNKFSLYMPRESTRNFLLVTKSSQERRIRRVLFFNRAQGRISGVIHFGADCEGPPRTVHGGCLAACIDAALGTCAYRTALVPCLTANLTINYHNKVPLGATVRIECWHVSTDDVPVRVPKIEMELGASGKSFPWEQLVTYENENENETNQNENHPTPKFPTLGKKLVFNFRMFSLVDENHVYASGYGLFVNAIIPNGKSYLPPILRFRSSKM